MNDTTDATAIFAPLWKRKWLILLVGLVVGAVTYAYYNHQSPTYSASTGIYLGGGSEIQALVGEVQTSSAESDRSISNQVVLINSSVIGDAVRHRLLHEGNLPAAAGVAEASSATGSDFIAIRSEAGSGTAAADLANAYAREYLRLREVGYRRNVNAALESTREQLSTIEQSESATDSKALQTQSLVERINSLESQLTLGDTGDQQINPAAPSATPLSPKPKRNAIFGFFLGVVLAGLGTYALTRFDRRLRSLADIESAFQAPVLTAIPSIRRPITQTPDGVPVPAQGLREPLRRLHTTLQLRALDNEIGERANSGSVLFISADAGDGKSTLVAGLALAQREAGERVVIVESDLRRPVQAELLAVDGSDGLAEVLEGKVSASDATRIVKFATETPALSLYPAGEGTATTRHPPGSAAVLPSGGTVANPPALLAGRAMPMLLHSLATDYDYVVVDAPPPLEVSDGLPLLAMVDAIVIVARVGHTGETSAQRLVDLLSRVPHAPIMGTVVNDASAADVEAFGFSSASYGAHSRRS